MSERISQLPQSTYQEERERVQRQTHGVETGAIEPYLRVLESIYNVRPLELLVVCSIAVGLKPRLNERAFLV